MTLQIIPIDGIGEIRAGDDLAALFLGALAPPGPGLMDGDVLVVTHKVVSKAEGRLEQVATDADYRALVEREAVEVVRRRGDLVIAITTHGFICANAGVDRSNVDEGEAVMLPIDPDRSAHTIRTRLERATETRIAVIITDTFGRAWRRGLSDVALGISGMRPILDLRGSLDGSGRELEVTEIAVADEIAAAADLVSGKATRVPAVVVRGFAWDHSDPGREEGRARELVRPPSEDLFR